MIINYIINSQIGLRRESNEDFANVFRIHNNLLAIVCDGLGGNQAGNIASKLAVESIHNYFITTNDEDDLSKVNSAIIQANESIILASQEQSKLNGMATTAEVLYLSGTRAFWGHVGDSRIYYSTGNRLIQLTKDHSVVQRLVDSGYITEKEAETHPHRNIIMRALGDKSSIIVDFDFLYLDETQPWKFLICSDGVSGVITKNEIEEYLKIEDLKVMSGMFSKKIEERGAPDNYTYIIISNKVN
jgi:protein phosphatase